MTDLVALFSVFQDAIGSFAGFGVDNRYSIASFSLLIALSFFAAFCLNHVAERRKTFHLSLSVLAMFVGGVVANGLLRGTFLPLGNELLITATLALLGMSVMALLLLVTYLKTEI
jgi:hypothetical protein